MTTYPKALRLADRLEGRWALHPEMQEAAAELRRLHTDAEESEALRERLSALLRNTAIALRGPEPELTRWSWHDLPDLAAALKAELRRLSAENERLHQINQSHEMKLSVRGYEIQIADLEAQRDALKQTLHDELAGNLRLRDLGGARPDEPMLTFLERIIAERDALLEALAVVLLEAEHTLLEPTRRKARAAIKAVEEGK